MGRRNKERLRDIRYGNATPIALQRQLDKVQALSEAYGGELVAEEILKLQESGELKGFWGAGREET